MRQAVFEDLYQFYKKNYHKIEKKELYKWEAIVHFQNTWKDNISIEEFPNMLITALAKVKNLMRAANYFPYRMITWAVKKEPETVYQMFGYLYDLDIPIDERILYFRSEMDGIIARNKEGKKNKGFQDDRAIMVYLNLRYPEKYFLYKYKMLKDFNDLVDYTSLPKAGSIDLIFVFESICERILSMVKEDEELLEMYEERRKKYYDPEYHLLVQDIIYSVTYYNEPADLEEKETEQFIKKFTLIAKESETVLKPVHVDFIQKAVSQKNIGEAGEELVFQYERKQVESYRLPATKQVSYDAKIKGDGLGYDILSYDKKGHEIYIEVKATKGAENESIFITANELAKSEEDPEHYYLYRVYDLDPVALTGKISIRKGSLRDLCIQAQSYKVDFR